MTLSARHRADLSGLRLGLALGLALGFTLGLAWLGFRLGFDQSTITYCNRLSAISHLPVLQYFNDTSCTTPLGQCSSTINDKLQSIIMSDLQRSFAKAKLAALPFEPPLLLSPEEDDEKDQDDEYGDLRPSPDAAQDDDSSSSASSASSTGTIIPSPSKNLFARPK